MGIFDQLRSSLGLDDEVDREKLKELGLEPRPPLDPRRWAKPGSSPEELKALEENAQGPSPLMVPPPPRREPVDLGETSSMKFARDQGMFDDKRDQPGLPSPFTDPRLAEAMGQGPASQLASVALNVNGGKPMAPSVPPSPGGTAAGAGAALATLARARQLRGGQPGGSTPNDAPEGKADLLAAIDKVARPPEQEAETPAPAVGQVPSADEGGGNPVRSLAAKLSTGAMGDDPRTSALRDALAKSARMKELANHVQGMGIGADLVEGVHVHGDQGKGLRDQADDVVRDAMLPTEFEQKNQRFDTEQSRAAQESKLRDSSELRAEHGDTRAASEEVRKQKGFETTQGETDPKSTTSANARASIQALYPKAWAKIPQQVRDGFSASDVKRIFGEVAMKDFATPGPSKQAGIADRQAVALAAHAKLPSPATASDLNDVLATIEAGKAPGTGYFMNKSGWQNFLRTPDGVAFKQKVQGVVNRHLREHSGMAVTPGEEERFMTQLGYGKFDEPGALDSGMHQLAQEMEADQQGALSQLPPEAKKKLEEQGAVRQIGGQHGKAIKGSTTKFDPEDSFDPKNAYPTLSKLLGAIMTARQQLGGGPKEPGGISMFGTPP